ncbi:C40 family peptidase [Lacrimispora sp.]|uniref:C40 family peptidase n=1 Tax=Lacrimispora sp. TaxID=2719234 RepID=UPI002FE6DD7C
MRQLKIKKVDDKPMIIHTKAKTKIHSHEAKSTGIKGHNVYSVKRSPKIMSATTKPQTMGKGAVRRRGKITYRKSTIHQNQEKRGGRIHQHNRNIKDDTKTIKTKNSSIKLVGAVGANAASNQMDGADEVRDAAMIAYGVTRPMTGAASKGAEFFSQKSLAEKKRKIKKVESGRKLARRQIKKTTQKVAKKAAKDTAKKVEKETAKKTAKVTTKVATDVAVTVAGTAAVGPLSPLIGIATGEVVGAKIDHDDMKRNSRVRKIKFFMDKMNSQDKQQDSLLKLLKDLVMNRAVIPLKKMALAVGGFLLILILLISVITVPVVTVIATIYNSPFALFLPPLEEGDTVMSVTTEYVANFNREINTLANEHNGYDGGEIVYVDYEGTAASPSNYYDIMCVYMVKHGIGDTATIMNDISKDWLQDIVNDMCSYTTSSRTETHENEDGTTDSETILSVNIMLKNYRDMITEYNFDEDQIELINEMMSPENLAMIGYSSGGSAGGSSSGNSVSSLTHAEIDEIVSSITDPTQKETVSFALSKVGYPYSQAYRDTENYYDCSSLVYYSWKAAGVDISFGGATTAAAEAQGLDEAGKSITEADLQPGDLIFYSYTTNGRYKNISHVGIYAGNGKMVEAKNEAEGVVYGDFHNGSVVMYARPNK